jgi:hypothetical protein
MRVEDLSENGEEVKQYCGIVGKTEQTKQIGNFWEREGESEKGSLWEWERRVKNVDAILFAIVDVRDIWILYRHWPAV